MNRRPARVALVARGGLGGSTSVARECAGALWSAGVEAPLFLGQESPDPRTTPKTTVLTPGRSPGDELVRALAKAHRESPFELVHVHFAGPLLGPALDFARSAGVPVVASLHGSDVEVAENPARTRRELADCALVSAPSHYLAERARDLCPQVSVLANFVDASHFEPARTWRPPPDPSISLRMLFVGHLEPWKGIDILLSALDLVGERGLAATVVGDGSLAEEVRKRAGAGVRLLGARPLTPGHLAEADLVVVPSRREAFGMVALEACAGARGVLASQVGGLPQWLGSAAHWVAPGDPKALAEALSDFVGEPARARALGAAGLRLVGERYDRPAGRSRLLAWYAKALA